jgi:hypothetical protein
LDLKLNFTYGEGKAPNGHRNSENMAFIEKGTNRLVPCMAFFGANASGKTNLLKALEALKNLVCYGPKLSEFFEPNLLNKKFSETAFALEFFIGSDCFHYSIQYNSKEILSESLRQNQKRLYSIDRLEADFSPQITSASYSQVKLTDILRVECSNGKGHQTKAFLHRMG